MGYELEEINYLKAPNKEVSAVVGYFAKGHINLNSITIAFKATSGIWNMLSNIFETETMGGVVDSGYYNMHLDFRPLLDEYHELLASLPKGFPLTLIGHAQGGIMATISAVELAEKYPQLKLTLITINTSRKWSKSYASVVDRVVPEVYRWREGTYVWDKKGDEASTHEIWNVWGALKCCPRPETKACNEGRGEIDDGRYWYSTYFNGLDMFGSDQCKKLERRH
jgi:hypothetical protein